jgi:hypothetical protein
MSNTLKSLMNAEESLKGAQSNSFYTTSPSSGSKVSAFVSGPQSPLLHDSNGFALDVSTTNETPWYKNGSAMEGYAGLASSFAELVSLPGQLKLAKLQRKGLQQNLDQAKVDSAFRASTRANLNRPVAKTGGA